MTDTRRRDFTARCLFFLALAALYVILFLLLRRTALFDPTGRHNDWLFSCDDVYYSTRFFSAGMDASSRIIKHPLLVVFGWVFTRLELLLLGAVSARRHYTLIILMQMAASYLTAVLLERTLERQRGLPAGDALLLCAVYVLACSQLFFTFVAESFILSGLLLMASFACAERGPGWLMAVLGALCAGVTVTNALLWAAILWLSGGRWQRKLLLSVGAGALFCALVAVLPVGRVFFPTILRGAMNSARNFSDSFPFFQWLARVFFAFFGSTAFWLDTADCSPFGDFPGDALSFLPSAPLWVVLAALAWLALLVLAAVRAGGDRRVLAPLAVLGLNFLLHGVLQYGLKEGFLYSLHHWGAQVLLASFLLRPGARGRWSVRAALMIFLACLVAFNVPGYLRLAEFLAR